MEGWVSLCIWKTRKMGGWAEVWKDGCMEAWWGVWRSGGWRGGWVGKHRELVFSLVKWGTRHPFPMGAEQANICETLGTVPGAW